MPRLADALASLPRPWAWIDHLLLLALPPLLLLLLPGLLFHHHR